jgi:hypothetical protein
VFGSFLKNKNQTEKNRLLFQPMCVCHPGSIDTCRYVSYSPIRSTMKDSYLLNSGSHHSSLLFVFSRQKRNQANTKKFTIRDVKKFEIIPKSRTSERDRARLSVNWIEIRAQDYLRHLLEHPRLGFDLGVAYFALFSVLPQSCTLARNRRTFLRSRA